MTFERAREILSDWTNGTARALRDGIKSLESSRDLARRERDDARDARDRALVESSLARTKGMEWMDRAVAAENRIVELVAAGHGVLKQFARLDNINDGRTPLAAYVLEYQAELIVNELLNARNNPMIREVQRLKTERPGAPLPVGQTLKILQLEGELRTAKDDLANTRALLGVAEANAMAFQLERNAAERKLDAANAELKRCRDARDTEWALLEEKTKELEEMRAENLRLRNELNQEQAIELTLVDRKGFERKITVPRRSAGPYILVPDPEPLNIRLTEPSPTYQQRVVSFRFAYGNVYKEEQR